MSERFRLHLLRSLGLLTVCLLLAMPGAVAAGQRVCTAAEIEEPFVLPDGSEYEAGSLKICKLQRHYPSSTLLIGYVNGHNVGMLLGRAGHNEAGPDAEPFMMFSRDTEGMLRLYGYGLADGNSVATFTLHRPDQRRTALLLPITAPERS